MSNLLWELAKLVRQNAQTEARREKSDIRHSEHAGVKIPQLALKLENEIESHQVTDAYATLSDLMKLIIDDEEHIYGILFHQGIQDLHEEKDIHSLLGEIAAHLEELNKDPEIRQILHTFFHELAEGIEKELKTKREEYTTLGTVIAELDKLFDEHTDHQTMLAAWRDFLKRNNLASSIEGLAWRRETSTERTALVNLHQDLSRLNNDLKMKDVHQKAAHLKSDLNTFSKLVSQMIVVSYDIGQRAFLMVLKLFNQLINTEAFLRKAVQDHKMPDENTHRVLLQTRLGMREIQEKLKNTVPQEFRRIINLLTKDEHLVEDLDKRLAA